MFIINNDTLKLILTYITSNKDILNIRLISKLFYKYYKKIIPYYISNNYFCDIYLNDNSIIWKSNDIIHKKIIFENYGSIKYEIDNIIFKKKYNYNLPNNIEYIHYKSKYLTDSLTYNMKNKMLEKKTNHTILGCIIT